MKPKYNLIYGIIVFNIIVAIVMLLQNSNKILIDDFWLNFIFYLVFLWNVLLISIIKKFKQNEKNH